MQCDDDKIEPALEVTDLEDPLQTVIALNDMSHTMVSDEGAGTAAADERGLMESTHSLHVALGEGQTPISLLFDEYAKELSFPQIYLGIHH